MSATKSYTHKQSAPEGPATLPQNYVPLSEHTRVQNSSWWIGYVRSRFSESAHMHGICIYNRHTQIFLLPGQAIEVDKIIPELLKKARTLYRQAEMVHEEITPKEIIRLRQKGTVFYTLCPEQSQGNTADGAEATYKLGILTPLATQAKWETGESINAAIQTQEAYSSPYYAEDALRLHPRLFQFLCSLVKEGEHSETKPQPE